MRSPTKIHSSVSIFLKYAHDHCHHNLRFQSLLFIVTPAHQANVISQAQCCSILIIAHTLNAAEALGGTVNTAGVELVI